MMISFTKLLSIDTDIFDSKKIKFVRHKDSRHEYRELIKDRDELLKYQAEQSKNVFKDCEYIFSFFGLESSKALFIGVFKVGEIKSANNKFYYELTEVDGFDDYKDRVVINWGKAAISWHQWANENDKEVVEILPKGYLGNFPGLLNFALDFNELRMLSENTEANKDWFYNLSSVNGIYLILDKKTGEQYVGSAYGKNGIWQRWSEYARNGHGGNKLLRELCESDANYHKNFRFTVLQTLPSNLSDNEVIAHETLYKEKLGTRAFGLNAN
ncbi:GIY-YIG nuclease family protein [Vibrio cholerae]|uniref:GIY-YIG nuclease family protein n=8 Tax=Vibrio cholerae TaxID=666 RepID=UPI00247B1F9B|nr:GIY-YIG nuclease family protein [Vibrio cholerae]